MNYPGAAALPDIKPAPEEEKRPLPKPLPKPKALIEQFYLYSLT